MCKHSRLPEASGGQAGANINIGGNTVHKN